MAVKQYQNKWTVGSLNYPDGLGIKDDLKHVVNFYINVRGKSKFVKNGQYTTVGDVGQNNLNNTRRSSRVLTATEAVERAGILAFGGSVVGGVAAAASKLFGGSGATAVGQAAAKGALAVGAIALGTVAVKVAAERGISILEPDQTKRLNTVISLHVQERPAVTYGINYQDKDMGILGGFLSGDTSASSTVGDGDTGSFAVAAALQLAKIPSLLPGQSASFSDILQFGGKVKTNPFREVFFEGVDYRKFNFRYKFMPKSKNEAQQVHTIIEKFKEHMHPELASNGYFYVYPSEFDIEYFYNNTANQYVNKIATCALTDMSVEYGGEQYSTFHDGSPTEINILLSFRELELLTKDSIRAGF